MLRTLAFTFLLVISTKAIVLADDPSAKSPDLLRLETDMLEARYLANKNDTSKKELLKNYDLLLPLTCKASHEKPTYIPEACQALLDKMIKIDEANPRALCYQEGFDSEQCKSSTASQAQNSTETPYVRLKKLLDSPPQQPRYTHEETLDPDRESVRRIADEILKLNLQYRKSRSPIQKEQILKLYTSLLPQVCKIDSGESYKPSPECAAYREQALIIDPQFQLGLCYRDGPTSPYCQGLNLKNGNSGTTQPRNLNNSGLETF